jgi:2-oxoglutarate ferredoxin oxidoreductase subunit alpha
MEDQGLRSVLSVPYSELAEDKIMANVAALGVVSAMIGLNQELVSGVVQDALGSKHNEMLSKNIQALHQGMEWASDQVFDFEPLPGRDASQSKLALNGNEAIALGALAGGVNFCSFYPMTPATSVALNLISQADELGVICEQAEDEISVINMALGASFCGARSLVPTSGGGFALMGEGISLAGMTETPIVIILAQRPGPATGLPTQTEQGDLELALASGHGAFPRAIMAPGNAEECFHLTIKALELAEWYQTPVILLTDQYLATSIRAVQRFDLSSINIPSAPGTQNNDPESYQRFAWSESGISPRLIPGAGRHLVVADSDEHTPDGHITEDHQIRVGMVEKRLKKLEGLIQETLPPDYVGDEGPELVLMTWGSSQGAVLEAAEIMRQQGDSVATLSFSQVWPLNPEHFKHYLSQAGRVISVEGNATGQLAKLIRRETGFQVHEQVLRYDGLPLTAAQILRQLQS